MKWKTCVYCEHKNKAKNLQCEKCEQSMFYLSIDDD